MKVENLNIVKQGNGEKALMVFHGFGQDNRAFSSYFDELDQIYTIYSFDLYYHGKSGPLVKNNCKSQWFSDFMTLLTQEKIEQFDLLTFSLGGRFALSLNQHFGSQIDKMVLLAPDGIFMSKWYRIATSRLGNPIFNYLMNHGYTFDAVLNFLESTRLTSHIMVRFARKELSTESRRKQVYQTWTCFRPLQIPIRDLRNLLTSHHSDVYIVLGDADLIIRESVIKSRLKGLKNVKLERINARHNQMIEAGQSLVSRLLKGE